MKFTVTMKDPDTLNDSICDAVRDDLAANPTLSKEDREALEDIRIQKISNLTSKWFRYSEYLTVEIDTDAGTCIVVSA